MADGTEAELVNAKLSAGIMHWIVLSIALWPDAFRHFSDFSRKNTFSDSLRVSKSPRDSTKGTNFL